MSYPERTRTRLRAAALALLILGVGAAVLGVMLQRSSVDQTPRRVPPSTEIALPAPGAFGGAVVIYGSPPGPERPTNEQLGCRLEGAEPGAGFDDQAAARHDRLVIEGRGVVPLLVVTVASEGRVAACSGPAAIAAQPLYAVRTTGVRELAPMAAYSLASLAIVMGAAGVLTLRPEPA